MSMTFDGEHDLRTDGDSLVRTPRAGAPGRSTMTGRMPASAASIARAVVAQLKADPSAVQARGGLDGPDVHAVAAQGTSGSGGSLPHLDQIQRAFGHHDVSGVRAHIGGAAAEASASLGARAYAAGDDVAFASAPDLHLAAHEAAHVVQQRAGVRLSGGIGAAGDEYERHADQVADAVCRGEFVEELLGGKAHRGAAGGPAVQRAHEQVAVQWGSTYAGDDSQLDLMPFAEVWVHGERTSRCDVSPDEIGTVRIQPGQSGVLRIALGVQYLIDNNWGNDEGSVQELAILPFRCDDGGRLQWGEDISRDMPPGTPRFRVECSASASGDTMTGRFQFTGTTEGDAVPQGGGGVSRDPVEANAGVSGPTTTNPEGSVRRSYSVRVQGPTSFGAANDEGGGGGGNARAEARGEAHGEARANARSESRSQSRSESRAEGGRASNRVDSHDSVDNRDTIDNRDVTNINVSPTINLQCPAGQEGQPPQQGQQPNTDPGQQPRAEPRSNQLLGEQSFTFEVNDDQLLARGRQPGPLLRLINWAEGVRDRNRETVDGPGVRIVVVGYASRTGNSDRNMSLSQRRARTIVNNLSEVFGDNITFADDPTGNAGGRGEDTSLNPDGTESADDRRAEVRIYSR